MPSATRLLVVLTLLFAARIEGGESDPHGGVQWFAVWEQARAEAARTGRPILLFSAAPQCKGIPGVW